jgi:hypothetical protein
MGVLASNFGHNFPIGNLAIHVCAHLSHKSMINIILLTEISNLTEEVSNLTKSDQDDEYVTRKVESQEKSEDLI